MLEKEGDIWTDTVKSKWQDLPTWPNMEEGKQAAFKHDSEVLSLGDLENGGDT